MSMRQISSVADDFPQQLDELLAWDMSTSSDVDVVVAPLTVRGCTLNGDALLSLQVHAVHLGAHAILAAHVVDVVDFARVVQHALCKRRLTRVDVR